MPTKKSQKEFEDEVFNGTNKEYTVTGEYVNNRTKISFKHLPCGTDFERVPKDFLNGKSRCPKCGYEKLKQIHLKNNETFKKEFLDKSKGEYILLGKYENSQKKVLVKHVKCGNEFEVTPNNFLSKSSGCMFCYGNPRKTTTQFKEEVNSIDNEYEVIGDYKGKNRKITFFHSLCNQTFEMTPDKFLGGHRCTNCNESKGESKIRKVLTELGLDFSKQFRFDDCRGKKYPLPFDFAVFKNNSLYCLIEYDGIQHFQPVNFKGIANDKAEKLFEQTKIRDNKKNDYCKVNKIKLIRIPYTQYDEIENIIKTSMGIPSEAC